MHCAVRGVNTRPANNLSSFWNFIWLVRSPSSLFYTLEMIYVHLTPHPQPWASFNIMTAKRENLLLPLRLIHLEHLEVGLSFRAAVPLSSSSSSSFPRFISILENDKKECENIVAALFCLFFISWIPLHPEIFQLLFVLVGFRWRRD